MFEASKSPHFRVKRDGPDVYFLNENLGDQIRVS